MRGQTRQTASTVKISRQSALRSGCIKDITSGQMKICGRNTLNGSQHQSEDFGVRLPTPSEGEVEIRLFPVRACNAGPVQLLRGRHCARRSTTNQVRGTENGVVTTESLGTSDQTSGQRVNQKLPARCALQLEPSMTNGVSGYPAGTYT